MNKRTLIISGIGIDKIKDKMNWNVNYRVRILNVTYRQALAYLVDLRLHGVTTYNKPSYVKG